ncbi:MAG: tetratricopeptide repeat protein [Terracidiphilus sp.]
MRLIWKIAVLVVCVAVIGGAVVSWSIYRTKANRQKLAEAVRTCRVRAEQGDAKAETSLAYMCSNGRGVPQDYAEAGRWYRKAAAQGYAPAENGLGYLYDLGLGVPKDYSEAQRWWRKAADQGYARAQFNLGLMYSNGEGMPQNRAEADRWYHKAADQGDEYARRALGIGWGRCTKLKAFFLLLQFVGGAFLSLDFLRPPWTGWTFRSKIAPLAGVLCLLGVGLNIWGLAHNDFRQVRSTFIALLLAKWLLDGVVLILLIYFLRTAKKTGGPGSPSFRQRYRGNSRLRRWVRSRKRKPMRYIGAM